MVKEDRFTVIFDEGDWILDQETGEYMDIEQACIWIVIKKKILVQ